MQDSKYCYPDSDVLINKLDIRDADKLFEAEVELTFIRLQELQENPIRGKYDFNHLKAIHKHIFQDLYDWAGKERTVEIGKGNLFCTTRFIQEYAKSVFSKYYSQCYKAKDCWNDFVKALADNYGDLNALHPFREGNGRAQREFARLVCNACGYDFDLSGTTHKEMLGASIKSFESGDNAGFIRVFSMAVKPYDEVRNRAFDHVKILAFDDLTVSSTEGYEHYDYGEYKENDAFDKQYEEKIRIMNS